VEKGKKSGYGRSLTNGGNRQGKLKPALIRKVSVGRRYNSIIVRGGEGGRGGRRIGGRGVSERRIKEKEIIRV